jgi:hypothetical protein
LFKGQKGFIRVRTRKLNFDELKRVFFINTLGANGKRKFKTFSLINIYTGDSCDDCSTVIPAI